LTAVAHTFSIVGRDRRGLLGVGVSSCVPAVGASCPFVRPGRVAVSSQAYLHPYLALDLIERLETGSGLDDAARETLRPDAGREWRQLIAIAPHGTPFAFTGAETDPWAGHVVHDDCAAAGNLLVSETVVADMADAFDRAVGESLPERLLRALEAAQAAGGDRRGRQSAALLVHASESMPFVHLRVDDHPDPVAELRRVFALYTPDDLERALRTATTREPRPLEDIRARQAQVRESLAERPLA
jgi:uncharacterized Ntn-hydrolase superfamily protein